MSRTCGDIRLRFSRAALAVLVVLSAAARIEAQEETIDFDTDVIPILTRFGCNAGSCHGAAVGRGGFRLSLYGGDPGFDYDAIVRELEGRRVNLAHPEDSLLLQKPTESLEHGGGYRFDEDAPAAARLLAWIRNGAPRLHQRTLTRFRVAPKRLVVPSVGESLPLTAHATFSDGTQRDVTQWTVFSATDASAIQIDEETAHATVRRPGRHIVIARYLDQVIPIELLVPLPRGNVSHSSFQRRNFIDDHVLELLQTLRLPPGPEAGDSMFLRRVTLDLTGRLPTPAEAKAFAADRDGNKRDRVIERLIGSEAFTDYWTYRLAELLRLRAAPGNDRGVRAYHAWLHRQVAESVPFDAIARALLLASGDTHRSGPANFYLTAGGPRKQAEFVSEVFMGTRLRCANCHNHPLDRWTQDDYHGLAAIFAGLRTGRVVSFVKDATVSHPRTGEAAVPKIPGEPFLSLEKDGREQLTRWLTSPDNPYFAKATVNRLWKALMGRGLVDPTDDHRATNPASHPELLEALASDFVQSKYDVRQTLRTIARSATYRRASSLDAGAVDIRYYGVASFRPLPPEVLADAIADVTGVPERYPGESNDLRAVQLPHSGIPSKSLDILGRCTRETSCEAEAGSQGGLTRMLHLMNGPLLNAKITSPDGRLARLIADGSAPTDIIETFYWRALSRPPSARERQYWKRELEQAKNSDESRRILEDVVWSLLTCREFVTNH